MILLPILSYSVIPPTSLSPHRNPFQYKTIQDHPSLIIHLTSHQRMTGSASLLVTQLHPHAPCHLLHLLHHLYPLHILYHLPYHLLCLHCLHHPLNPQPDGCTTTHASKHLHNTTLLAHLSFSDQIHLMLVDVESDDNPNLLGMINDLSDMPTLKAALAVPEEDQWVQAICSNLDNIKSKDVYDLVNPTSENIENLLGNKIVLHHKWRPTGKVECYKA